MISATVFMLAMLLPDNAHLTEPMSLDSISFDKRIHINIPSSAYYIYLAPAELSYISGLYERVITKIKNKKMERLLPAPAFK